MRLTTYLYPWDLARLGVERTLQRVADDGIDAIDLAATYHPIDSVSPREGMHLFSDARGAVYFPTRAERYGRVKPLMHSPELCAVWPEAARCAGQLKLGLNAWTITLFQPWIRDRHPECARTLPSGDRSGSGVCPANEDVREFLAALAEDVVDQFGVDLVRLESVMPIFDFDWLRPRTLVQVPPLARTLLNLCFCAACARQAQASGLDIARLRRVVADAVGAEIEDGQTRTDRVEILQGDAELRRFVCAYVQNSVGVVRDVASRIGGRARVSVNAAASYELLLGAVGEAALLEEFVAAADQLAVHPGNPRNGQLCAIAAGTSPPREISALVPLFGATVSAGPVLQARAPSSEVIAAEAVKLGASELSLYNYGLLGERDAAAFAGAVRRGLA